MSITKQEVSQIDIHQAICDNRQCLEKVVAILDTSDDPEHLAKQERPEPMMVVVRPDRNTQRKIGPGCIPLHTAMTIGSGPGLVQLIAKLLQLYPEGAKKNGDTNRTGSGPERPPIDVRRTDLSSHLLEAQKLLLEAYPGYLNNIAPDSKFPFGSKLVKDRVKMVMEVCPDWVKTEDQQGNLPLHRACQYTQPLSVVKLLLEAYPEGVKHPSSKTKKLPIHLLSEVDTNLATSSSSSWGNQLSVAEKLEKLHPQSLSAKDDDGNTPLHYAAKHKGHSLAEFLCEKYPSAAKQKNRKGQFPVMMMSPCLEELGIYFFESLADASPDAFEIKDHWLKHQRGFLEHCNFPQYRQVHINSLFEKCQVKTDGTLKHKVEVLKEESQALKKKTSALQKDLETSRQEIAEVTSKLENEKVNLQVACAASEEKAVVLEKELKAKLDQEKSRADKSEANLSELGVFLDQTRQSESSMIAVVCKKRSAAAAENDWDTARLKSILQSLYERLLCFKTQSGGQEESSMAFAFSKYLINDPSPKKDDLRLAIQVIDNELGTLEESSGMRKKAVKAEEGMEQTLAADDESDVARASKRHRVSVSPDEK